MYHYSSYTSGQQPNTPVSIYLHETRHPMVVRSGAAGAA